MSPETRIVILPISKVTGIMSRTFKFLRSSLQLKGSEAAVQAVKVCQTAQKISRDERFLQCLAEAPAVAT